MSQSTISPDGLYIWDGARWLSTLSGDGAWRWSGTAWIPTDKGQALIHVPEPYASSRTLAVCVSALLGLCAMTALVSTFIFEVYFDLTMTLGNQDVVYEVDLGGLLVFVITAVVFLRWLHRSYVNLAALGAQDLRFTPGWAVGWWFVPFACLWMPYRASLDMWHASDPRAPIMTTAQLRAGSGAVPVVACWWVAWITSIGLVSAASLLIYPPAVQNLLFVSSAAATCVAGALGIVVVRSITARQDARWHRSASAIGRPVSETTWAPASAATNRSWPAELVEARSISPDGEHDV